MSATKPYVTDPFPPSARFITMDIDICFVQESQISDPNFYLSLSRRWSGRCFWSPAIGRQGGVITFISDRFNCEVISWRKDYNGRILSILLLCGNTKINVVNIYAPTNLTERKPFFDSLHEFFFPADFLVIGGDFKCYEHEMDKLGGNIWIADYLTDFCSSFGLINCWRKLHPRSRELTWFNSDFSIGLRLDKFFVSKSLRDNLLSSSISPCCLSDHDFLDLHFQLVYVPTSGPGIWKFNASLLRDSAFNDLISSRISELAEAIDSFADVRNGGMFVKTL